MKTKCWAAIMILQWNCWSIAANWPYLNQHLASKNYHVLLLQSQNVCRNKFPILQNYPPPILQLRDVNGQINTAIYIQTNKKQCFPITSPAPIDIQNLSLCTSCVQLCKTLSVNFVSVYLQKGHNETNRIVTSSSKSKWKLDNSCWFQFPFSTLG